MSSPTDERRRSSGTFANLMGVKRSTDEAATARRMSQSDHYAKPGIIGSMWQSWTKGTAPSPPKEEAKPAAPTKQSIHRTGAGTLG